ncbi:hypothetical protein RvY_18180 [Ramazzottius varieornatus]|uniref:DDE-1 domain-containing protein n=1 Tax=Ramazzottius varieornatus TaxID=947166 RepID=A0A1D1W892_RAMVA|nr:hypothetical protein RvY_18180 [Ramazzottius varieornatus]
MFNPLVLFDRVLYLGSMYDNTKDKVYVAVNRSGVMDHKVLTDYFRQEVLPNAPDKALLANKKSTLSIYFVALFQCVVLIDGHYSHVTNIQLFKLCIESGKFVCLISLPSGQTDKLQPLDSCPLETMKPKWTAYKSFHRINPQCEITRNTSPGVLAELCTPGASMFSFEFEASLKSGFRKTGVFPFSPDVIPRTVDKELIKYDEPSLPVLDRESFPKKKVAAILRADKVKMDDAMVEASLESIDHIRSDYKSVANMVLSAAGKAFAFSKPKKQRKAKDTRVALEAGRNMLSSEYMEVIEQLLKLRKEPSKNTPKSRGGTNRKGMAREPSPSACLPVPDIPSKSEPKSMPKKSRKKKVCSPEEPSACPLSNADVGTLVPAPPKKRIESKKVQ